MVEDSMAKTLKHIYIEGGLEERPHRVAGKKESNETKSTGEVRGER